MIMLFVVVIGAALCWREPGQAGASSLSVGVFVPRIEDLAPFESAAGRRTDIFLWYSTIEDDFDAVNMGTIAAGGRTIQLSWEPRSSTDSSVNQPAYALKNITRGDFDIQLHRWARQLRDFGYPVLFRPMCEMNGDWTSWGGAVNGNQPADFIPSWRHIHDIFAAEGATNVKWVWSPNADTSAASAQATFGTYYPGDGYVDYVGMNGYNWGTSVVSIGYSSSWQSLAEVFGYSYDVAAASTSKPIMISETASTELGGNKAAWIADAFAQLPARFPRVTSLTWFNINKETDWRIQSSSTSLQAFRNAMSGLAPPVICRRPNLTLKPAGTYWNSYSDYAERLLSVNLRVGNEGAAPVLGLRFNGGQSSNGVTLATGLPVTVGDIAGYAAATVTLTYRVATNERLFRMVVNASGQDACGNSYAYPAAASYPG